MNQGNQNVTGGTGPGVHPLMQMLGIGQGQGQVQQTQGIPYGFQPSQIPNYPPMYVHPSQVYWGQNPPSVYSPLPNFNYNMGLYPQNVPQAPTPETSSNPQNLKAIEDYICGLLGRTNISQTSQSTDDVKSPEEEPTNSERSEQTDFSLNSLKTSNSNGSLSSSSSSESFWNGNTEEQLTAEVDALTDFEENKKPQEPSSRVASSKPDTSSSNKENKKALLLTLVHPTNFDTLSIDIYNQFQLLKPNPGEFYRRMKLLNQLQKIVIRLWPESHPQLRMFGSSANGFGTKSADMDICLTIDESAGSMQKIVSKLGDTLRKKNMKHVKSLTRARVPIVKFTDPATSFQCDVCINNGLALQNTKLLNDYSKLDPRVLELGHLVKYWAKQREINDTYQGTLSSYAYILMVINFLQQRDPPVLPCLQMIVNAGEQPVPFMVGTFDCYYFKNFELLKGFGSKNKESVGELLAAFFRLYACEFDWENFVVSPRTGRYLTKDEKGWHNATPTDDPRDNFLFGLEDPFEVSHNLGRVVDKENLEVIQYEFLRAYKFICSGQPLKEICKPYDIKEKTVSI